MKQTVNTNKQTVEAEIDENIFPREVITAAAYVYLDSCYIRLERASKKKVKVYIRSKKKVSAAKLKSLAGDFENEVLHQLLRYQLAEKTQKLREIIVGRALLSAQVQVTQPGSESFQAEDEDPDYLQDPLGIAVPWEEKYGDSK